MKGMTMAAITLKLDRDLEARVSKYADGIGVPLEDLCERALKYALSSRYPDQGLPGSGARPDNSLPRPPFDGTIDNELPDGEIPPEIDNSLPGYQPRPDQGLPPSSARPDQGLPGQQPGAGQDLPGRNPNPNPNPDLDADADLSAGGPKPTPYSKK
jgi:hypothetical protein